MEEHREAARRRLTQHQSRAARYYNSCVKWRRFDARTLVLREVMLNTKDRSQGALGPNWEGPYHVTGIIRLGAYTMEACMTKLCGTRGMPNTF